MNASWDDAPLKSDSNNVLDPDSYRPKYLIKYLQTIRARRMFWISSVMSEQSRSGRPMYLSNWNDGPLPVGRTKANALQMAVDLRRKLYTYGWWCEQMWRPLFTCGGTFPEQNWAGPTKVCDRSQPSNVSWINSSLWWRFKKTTGTFYMCEWGEEIIHVCSSKPKFSSKFQSLYSFWRNPSRGLLMMLLIIWCLMGCLVPQVNAITRCCCLLLPDVYFGTALFLGSLKEVLSFAEQ